MKDLSIRVLFLAIRIVLVACSNGGNDENSNTKILAAYPF